MSATGIGILQQQAQTAYPPIMSKPAVDYRSLGVSERIELVEEIWNSIADETSDAPFQMSAGERAELHRRLAAHDVEPSSSIPWEEVREKLFKSER